MRSGLSVAHGGDALGSVLGVLERGQPVLVETPQGMMVLDPGRAAGYPPSRRLDDLPLRPVGEQGISASLDAPELRRMAHDINNLLMPALFSLEPGIGEAPDLVLLEQALGAIRRLAAGVGLPQRAQRCDLASVIQGISPVLRVLVRPAALRLDLQVETMVRAFEGDLIRIVTNLCSNAGQAIPDAGGVVWIRLQNGLDAQSCLLQIEDSGPGIPPALRERVFQVGYTTRREGTGLGLPSVRRLVHTLGGEISVSDSELGGACLVVRLPLAT